MMHRNIWRVIFVVAMATVSFVAEARAGDDGGGRSVFALGAGNRPLGMGGAYAAIADDASAPLWNPGGIGLIFRKQLEVTQTGYYDFGINEQYASFVFPSWRWGVLSSTFRHFGVSDVEQRDDRNVLKADDLSDHQTEFALGYGKTLGSAWSLGGVLKLQSQSLAGYSGSGVGMDLGVIVKPLIAISPNNRLGNRFTVGVALRNILEPKIRLVNDKVPDPLGFRLGAAAWIPLFRQHNVLAAFDIEKTSQMNTRFHAGLEFPIGQILSLRAGFEAGVFTAGTSVEWHNIGLSYVFENTDLGGVNRLGISVSFGRTVLESRQAFLDAEEEKLQASLAAAFDERQKQRVRQLLAQADTAKQSGNCEDALNILTVVDALDPDNQRARSLEIGCLNEIAVANETSGDYAEAMVVYSQVLGIAPDDPAATVGYKRSKQASDSQAMRSADIREQFEAALQAFSVQRWVVARDGFESVLKMAPQDKAAATMLERTNEAIDYRCDELLADAERFTGWGYFKEAQESIAGVRGLNPQAPGLGRAEARLIRAREKAQFVTSTDSGAVNTVRKEAAYSQTTNRSPISEKQRREVERLYVQGTGAMKAGRRDDAVRYLELVWSMDPTYRNTVEHLKRQYQTRGMEYFADGDIDRAEEIWEKALRVDPNDQRTLGYLSRAREQRARESQIFGRNK
jgi:tetratricopeptide (TPR) repeat protein